jgi:hypothetical protein
MRIYQSCVIDQSGTNLCIKQQDMLVEMHICTSKFAYIRRQAFYYTPFYKNLSMIDGIRTESLSMGRIIDARLVVGQSLARTTTFGRSFLPGRALSCDGGRRLRAGYTEYNTPFVQLSTHTHLTAAMFVRRVATGLAKRAAFRPVAARPFSSSFARCKPQSPKRIPLIMTTQTHPLNHQSTSTATPSPANTPTKSSPSRVRLTHPTSATSRLN